MRGSAGGAGVAESRAGILEAAIININVLQSLQKDKEKQIQNTRGGYEY